ncbi:hypothetical protein [Williamsia sp. M5A3_1d]
MTSPPPDAPTPAKRSKTVLLVSVVLVLTVAVALLVVLVVDTRTDPNASPRGPLVTQTSTVVVSAPTDASAPTTGSSDGLFGKNRLESGQCENRGRCELSSPSGNFYCAITAEQASCFAPQGEALVNGVTVALSGEPGKQVAANGIGVDSSGQTSIFAVTAGVSSMLTRQDMARYRFPYDNQLQVLGYTCAVGEQTGVSCKNDQTGHGFSVTKQRYFFF